MSEQRLLDGDVTVRWTGTYVRVWHRKNASNLEELEVVLTGIEDGLRANESGYLLFDSRDVEYTPGDVQQGIWDWLASHPTLVRVATLVESEALAVSVNMNGLGRRIPIRAFHDERSAAGWLASGRIPR